MGMNAVNDSSLQHLYKVFGQQLLMTFLVYDEELFQVQLEDFDSGSIEAKDSQDRQSFACAPEVYGYFG
ncbi:unnamed protein product [Haemonchus placei]|uniref:DUF2326 domain-containing protein n=1 Tax=Haemonchus placei TaxID=6290 RepID=A0A0N4WVD7_HAEPC|nr:unnamed protein product [Haemonchus placei]